MRPLVAHCHLGLGELCQQRGDGFSEDHLTIAETMYREMNIRFGLGAGEGDNA
jgi:hypothetical protein